MRNLGVIFIIIGLVIFFILGLPAWLVKLIGFIVTVFGIFVLVAPDKASVFINKFTPKKEKEEKE